MAYLVNFLQLIQNKNTYSLNLVRVLIAQSLGTKVLYLSEENDPGNHVNTMLILYDDLTIIKLKHCSLPKINLHKKGELPPEIHTRHTGSLKP